MPKTSSTIASLRDELCRHARPRLKIAALGGEQDAPFEKAFSNLAHAYLKDKAPSLLEYEVGFQLVDRNQENTKAIGVFGFKVGSQWLYAPVFFLNGDLKGHELLYIKNQDMFVPMKENWLNYILNKKPNVLGSEVGRNLQEIGVAPPHLYQLSRSPNKFASHSVLPPEAANNQNWNDLQALFKLMEEKKDRGEIPVDDDDAMMAFVGQHLLNKPGLTGPVVNPKHYASWKKTATFAPWAIEAMPTIAYLATTNPGSDKKFQDIVDLPSFLKKEGKAVVKSLVLGFQENPKLASVFDKFHGLKTIDEALAAAKEREKEASSNSVLKTAKCVNTTRGVRCFKPVVKQQPKSVLEETPATQQVDNAGPEDTIKTAGIGDPIDPGVQYAQQKKVKILVYDEVLQHGTGLENLNDKDREKLLKEKVLIKDERPDAPKAYEVTSPVRLQNPMETGLYDVLTKDNKFEKCLIIFGPYNQKGRKGFATLVRVSDGDDDKGRAWLNIHSSHLWVGHQYRNEEFQDWWKKLKEVKDLPVSNRGLHILIGNTGEGTLPFTVEKEVSTDVRKIYDVWFKNHAEKERADHLPPISTRLMRYRGEYSTDDGCRIQLTGKRGARLRATGGDLYVPTDYRCITLRPAEGDDDSIMGICGCDAHSDPSPIQPGNQFDIDILLGTKTASVKMFVSGTEYVINNKRMQKIAALIHLVRDYGFREKTARLLLKKAETEKVYRFRIKKAEQSYDLQKTGPSSPPIPETPTGYDPMTGGQVPTQNVGEWNVKIPEMSAALTDRMLYHPMGPDPDYQQGGPDRHAQQVAMQAAQSGQKEIFDTAMIGSLLKAVRDDSMVDRYIGDLMKALDRLGRILFLFYWHGDKFQERYGKGDMIELEDGIRNAFEYLGDLVLFLTQRAANTSESQMGVHLGEISGD